MIALCDVDEAIMCGGYPIVVSKFDYYRKWEVFER